MFLKFIFLKFSFFIKIIFHVFFLIYLYIEKIIYKEKINYLIHYLIQRVRYALVKSTTISFAFLHWILFFDFRKDEDFVQFKLTDLSSREATEISYNLIRAIS